MRVWVYRYHFGLHSISVQIYPQWCSLRHHWSQNRHLQVGMFLSHHLNFGYYSHHLRFLIYMGLLNLQMKVGQLCLKFFDSQLCLLFFDWQYLICHHSHHHLGVDIIVDLNCAGSRSKSHIPLLFLQLLFFQCQRVLTCLACILHLLHLSIVEHGLLQHHALLVIYISMQVDHTTICQCRQVQHLDSLTHQPNDLPQDSATLDSQEGMLIDLSSLCLAKLVVYQTLMLLLAQVLLCY